VREDTVDRLQRARQLDRHRDHLSAAGRRAVEREHPQVATAYGHVLHQAVGPARRDVAGRCVDRQTYPSPVEQHRTVAPDDLRERRAAAGCGR
jgi:hypothetical protein